MKLSDRYITGRFLPDKAIDVMDEAGARARINAMTRPPDVKEIEKEIEDIRTEKEGAIKAQDFEKAAALRDNEKQTKEKLDTILAEWREQREEKRSGGHWRRHDAHRLESGPAFRCNGWSRRKREKLLKMEEELSSKVIGQDEAVIAISKALRRSRADLKDPRRPIGSFIFLGPTGVGKTFLAQTLAEFMFGDRDALIQIDMSRVHGEVHRFAVDRVASGLCRLRRGRPAFRSGPPPPVFRGPVRRNRKGAPGRDASAPANPGRGQNHRLARPQDRFPQHHHHHDVECRRGNAHEDKRRWVLLQPSRWGNTSYEAMRDRLLEEAKKVFKPEFINRLDDIIVFHQLTKADLMQIVESGSRESLASG